MKKKLLLIALIASCSTYAQTPTVLNNNFDKIDKSSGTACSCSGWVNKDLGDQAESSEDIESVVGNDAIKFDNEEADLMYQEIAVSTSTNYKLTYRYRISGDISGTSQLEIRVLKGSGYKSGYTPTYYASPDLAPQSDFGYSDIANVELSANNLLTGGLAITESFPGDDDYHIKEITFNSGTETSIAILARGVGRPTTAPSDGKPYTWSAGDQESRIDYITLTNEDALSNNTILANSFNIYPNPVQNTLTINTNGNMVTSVSLYTIIGKQVYQDNAFLNNKIDVSNFNKGIYLLKVTTKKGSFSKRIVIQ